MREKKGLSQAEVAAKLGISVRTLERWEKDGATRTMPIMALATVYGVEMEELVA